jgi:hypothetical protein
MRMMHGNTNSSSKKLAPLLRQALRLGVEAASRGEDRNQYFPGSHLYHAWVAGWAALARGWDADDLRPSRPRQPPTTVPVRLPPPALGIGVESD